MKNLNDFISEEAKNKKDSKKRAKKNQGVDDMKYMTMMGKYKQLRKNPDKKDEANELLQQCFKLAREGDVSEDAHTAAAYL
jgi:hypothetical protein